MGKKTSIRARVFEGDGLFDWRDITVTGRYAQALKALVEGGSKGVTALEISSWALRLSHYIHILRKDERFRLDIETINEEHEVDGMGPGIHGRYVLKSRVELLADTQEAA